MPGKGLRVCSVPGQTGGIISFVMLMPCRDHCSSHPAAPQAVQKVVIFAK